MGNIDQKNLIIAIALSIAIVLGFEFFYNLPRMERDKAQQAERAASQAVTQVQQPAAQAPSTTATPATAASGIGTLTREAATAGQGRLSIKNSRIEGSLQLNGGRLDDLVLTAYRETADPTSPPITLLSPQGTPMPYFAEFGWVAGSGNIAVPGPDTQWVADRDLLAPGRPVKLTWNNAQGLRFERRISIDDEYMFEITQRVTNTSGDTVTLFPYALASRTGTPKTSGYYILHEGPLGVFNGTLSEQSYDDLKKQRTIEKSTTGGWIGFTDKYWLVAVIPDQKKEMKARYADAPAGGVDMYQVDMLGGSVSLPPNGTAESTARLFAGPKEVKLLNAYAENPGIARFDLAVDWGWFWFFTKPIFAALDFFYRLLGNFGLAILLLTVIIKAVFFPLANKSYRAMNKMKLLQPEMEKLRQRFGEDKQRLSQEMMGLYKREGANPLAGCLPVVIQIPVFFALYKVIFITIEMRHAPFFGWIHDLSAHDPTSVFNLFGLLPWAPPETYLMGGTLGAWPLIMGLTMFLQQKMNPQPPDPVQAKVMMAMPLIFTFMLANFPSGLVIYWAWNNTLSVLQQWLIMRQMGHAPGGKSKGGKDKK